MHRPSWPPIYPNIKASPTIRIQADVPVTDHQAIVGTAANTGVISFVIQQAIKLTAEYVRNNNLSYLDSDRFLDYLRERSFVSNTEKATLVNVARRTEKIRNGVKNLKDKRTESGKVNATES
jgi:hypothetical protein